MPLDGISCRGSDDELEYIKPERVQLASHPELNELWVHDLIKNDPSILGLGDLELVQSERRQRGAGRLDLLLRDADIGRYELEIQLGATDESHTIRTIEYWDKERKRYPEYAHTAVIVAEEITSRFFNVISLFNGFIPLVAIQMQAFKIGDQVSLVFTTVLNKQDLGPEELPDPTDRAYWEEKGSKATVEMADQLLAIIHEFNDTLALKYNKFYIGLARDGQPNNFVTFVPQRRNILARVKLTEPEVQQIGLDQAQQAELNDLEPTYNARTTNLILSKEKIEQHRAVLNRVMQEAHDR